MLFLAFKNLRARLGRTVFTALAIALGVGMIFATRLVAATLDETARQARLSRLVGADLEITSGVGAKIPLGLLEKLDARPEVELAAPLYRGFEGRMVDEASFTMAGAELQGTGLMLLGVDEARLLVPHELVAGEEVVSGARAQRNAIWLPNDWAALNGLRAGSKLTLTTGEITQDYVIAGLIRQPSEVSLQGQPTAWVPLNTLNTAFNTPDTATSILIRLRPGITREQARTDLQAELGDQYLISSAEGGGSVGSVYDILSLALPVAGFAVLLAGAFLVFNAFAITLAERKREIGQLRTLGMTRRQVLLQTLAEAGLIGLLGSLLGLLMGWALGRGVVEVLAALQGDAALSTTPIPPDAAPLALGAGVLVTLAVTFGLAAQAARISPLLASKGEAVLRPNALRPYNVWIGLGLLAATVAAFFYSENSARAALTPNWGLLFLPLLFLIAAVLSLLPAWLNGLLNLARRLFTGATARLALGNLARGPGRATLTAATLVISLMLVIALTGITLFMSAFLITFNASIFSGYTVLVRPFPPGTSLAEISSLPTMSSPPPAEVLADFYALSDEAEISYYANVNLPGLGVDAAATGDRYGFAFEVDVIRDKRAFPLMDGTWDEVARAFVEHDPAIFLPELTARKFNKQRGDTLTVKTLEGEVDFYIAGTGGAFPVISPASAARYFGSHPFAILLKAKPGVNQAQLEERVNALIKRHSTQISLLDTESLVSVVDQLIGPIQGLFTGLTSLSGLVAALGIVVTLIASVLERQRELGTLRALGMSRAQVRQTVLIEAGVVGFAGASLGAVGGVGMAWLFALSMNTASVTMLSISAVEDPPLPWLVALAAVVIGPLVAVLAALWPADRAANVNPAEAMRAEGATGFLKAAQHLGPTGVRGFFAHMPLAAKLSLASGVILVVALAVQTAVRVNAERQLIEDNLLTMLARSSEPSIDTFREQLPAEMTELTPATLAAFNQDVGAQQAEALQAQFRRWRTAQSENDFQLLYFLITDTDRTVIYSDDAEWLGRVLTDTVTPNGSTTAVRLTSWAGERVFEGTVPIENQAGVRLGYLQAGLSAAPIDNFIQDVITSSLWTMVLMLLAAIALTVWFTQRALKPVAQIAQASKAVARGDLSQRVPETNWDEVGSLARSFNEMVKGLNEREHMRDLFGRYLSREVGEAVLSGKVTLTGERKTITCLYVDMRGSTAFAEKHAPEDVMAALNQYFEVIILATEAHGGIVNRFVGDEAVCVFGAPREYRDHADRALQAALAMREGLAYLNQKRATLNLPTLKFGMGLNTGDVVAGATGSEERQEYTVIGDAMNAGARIQALNKQFPDQDILLSEFTQAAIVETRRGASQPYAFIDLGPVELRGKSELVRIFGVEKI